MDKRILKRWLAASLVGGVLVFSLASVTDAGKRLHDQAAGVSETKVNAERKAGTEEKPGIKERIEAILHPKEPEKPATGYTLAPVDLTNGEIFGQPMATEKQCLSYLLKNNPRPDISVTPEELVSYYYEEATREGIRPDVAFAQAIHETGHFRYGGTVTPDQNNYCGLGTTSATVKGGYFPTAQIGVRAHIQHILAYATTKKPTLEIVDPRYELVRSRYGNTTFSRWDDFDGRWAVPGVGYGRRVFWIFQQILAEPTNG